MTTDAAARPRRISPYVRFLALTLAVVGCLVAAFECRLVGDAIERNHLAAFYAQPVGLPTAPRAASSAATSSSACPSTRRALRRTASRRARSMRMPGIEGLRFMHDRGYVVAATSAWVPPAPTPQPKG